MGQTRSYLLSAGLGAGVLALAACGGGDGSSQSTTSPSPPAVSAFLVTALDSNTAAGTVDTLPANLVATGDSASFTIPAAMNATLDANLSGAWGIAFAPNSAAWVNDEASNMSSLYDGAGAPIAALPSVSVPGGPTGIVANLNTINCPTVVTATCTGSNASGFTANGATANFLFVNLKGAVYAWASGASALQMASGATGSSYTGVATITQSSGASFLLAANFGLGRVDVYDTAYKPNATAFPGGFKNPNLPKGYAPFGIQQIGGRIYVSYAVQPASPGPEVDGPGLGQIDVFDATGTLVKTLVAAGGVLNAPWGMTVAPQGFGFYGGDLLVGNFGHGRTNVFDPNSGQMIAAMTDVATNAPVRIPGLWGLAFSNDSRGNASTTLYFAAQPDHKTQGLHGAIALSTSAAGNPFAF